MKIDHKELKALLPEGYKLVLDASYICPPEEKFRAAVGLYIRNRGQFNYDVDSHDCDNAAWEFVGHFSGWGWAVGLAVVHGHAVCAYVTDKKELKFVEPQTGEEYTEQVGLAVTIWP